MIECIYCRKYIGTIDLKQLIDHSDNIYGYRLILGMGCDQKPLEIAFDGDFNQFLKYLDKRLHEDHLADETYSYGMRGFFVDDVNFNPRDKELSTAEIPDYQDTKNLN